VKKLRARLWINTKEADIILKEGDEDIRLGRYKDYTDVKELIEDLHTI
jgi:hypothetical protein